MQAVMDAHGIVESTNSLVRAEIKILFPDMEDSEEIVSKLTKLYVERSFLNIKFDTVRYNKRMRDLLQVPGCGSPLP